MQDVIDGDSLRGRESAERELSGEMAPLSQVLCPIRPYWIAKGPKVGLVGGAISEQRLLELPDNFGERPSHHLFVVDAVVSGPIAVLTLSGDGVAFVSVLGILVGHDRDLCKRR